MRKYAKVINEINKMCEVGLGSNTKFYQSIGMTEQEVEQAYNGIWYLKGHAPQAPEPTYIELRQAAYPPVGDQLDMIYWDQVNGTDIWRQTIAAIKAEYPKPVENQTGEAAAANDGTDETVSSATDASEQDILSWTGA